MDFTEGSVGAELGAELALVLAAGGFAELELLVLLESVALLALLALFGAREHAAARIETPMSHASAFTQPE